MVAIPFFSDTQATLLSANCHLAFLSNTQFAWIFHALFPVLLALFLEEQT
jgi:hypothetical protein